MRRLIVLVAMVGSIPFGFACPADAGVPAVASTAILGMDPGPRAVVVADFTDDGRADALVRAGAPTGGGDQLVLYVQEPGGGLRPQPVATLGGGDTLVTADVNGDGRADVVATDSAGVLVFVQRANGLSHTPTTIPLAGAYAVAVGDVTGDGRADIVAARPDAHGGSVLVLLTNTGSGWARSVLRNDGLYYPAVAVGDVTGDGRADVVTFHPGLLWTAGRPTLVVIQWTAQGLRSQAYAVTTGLYRYAYGVTVGDVTGDGKQDVVVSIAGNQNDPPREPGSMIDVFRQTARGTLSGPSVYETYDNPQPVVVADLDGDGRADVVTADGGESSWGVLPQFRDGTLAGEAIFSLPPSNATDYGTSALAIGDLNADGRLDVAVADVNYGLIVATQGVQTDTTPPTTTITSGPSGTTSTPRAQFMFAQGDAASYECSVDGSPFSYYCADVFTVSLPAGTHTVRVRARDVAGNTDPVGASRTWTICCTARVPNDAFQSPQEIAGSSGMVNGTTVGATFQSFEPWHAGYGGHSIWYVWVAPATGTVTFDTDGSGFDTVLAAYLGTFLDGLVAVAQNADEGGGSTASRITLQVTAGERLYLAVDTQTGATGPVRLAWSETTGS